jgi:protein gp37
MIEGAAQALYHARTDEDPSLWLAVRWPLPNAWLGVSCEDQRRADERIPLLLQTPAAVRFVSVEPLLGPVDLRPYLRWRWVRVTDGERTHVSAPSYGELAESAGFGAIWPPVPIKGMLPQPDLGWCVIGGESGPGARPCDLAWIRSLVDQCRVVQVPAFVKQLGTRPFDGYFQFSTGQQIPDRLRLRDRKGGEMGEWPEDLRVREFPR